MGAWRGGCTLVARYLLTAGRSSCAAPRTPFFGARAGAWTRARSAASSPTRTASVTRSPRISWRAEPTYVIQELLGHSSLSTTQVYSHVDGRRLRRVYDRSHPRSVMARIATIALSIAVTLAVPAILVVNGIRLVTNDRYVEAVYDHGGGRRPLRAPGKRAGAPGAGRLPLDPTLDGGGVDPLPRSAAPERRAWPSTRVK